MSKVAVGVDWLSATFDCVETFSVGKMLAELFGSGEVEQKPHRFRSHRISYAIPGVSVAFNDGGDGQAVDAWSVVELSGEALGRLRPESVQWLFAQLVAFRATVTRLDIRADDYAKRITPAELWAVYAEPRHFSGFKHRNYISGGGDVDGSGVYFGKRGKLGGGLQVVYYDKSAESQGAEDCYRWECRFAKEKAHAAFRLIMAVDEAALDVVGLESYDPPSVEAMGRTMGELVGGSITFFEAGTGDKNLERRELAGFWASLRESLRRGQSEHPPNGSP